MPRQSDRVRPAGLSLAALSEIADAELRGDPARVITGVETLKDAGAGEISFLANPRYRSQLLSTKASAVILAAGDAANCPVDCLVSDNPYLAHARVMNALYPIQQGSGGAHPSAFIEDSASVAPSVEIGANCYLGAGVVVEEGAFIGPGCILLDDVVVGAYSRLVAAVTLCADTRLGRGCLVHPGAVIGSDGFGLANDQGAWVKVPQIGRAVLGDEVEVGSCSSIDCGAIGDTVIASGVKIDSQVHIGHNVQIGEHTAIAGCAGIAGSAQIGAYCTIAGGVGVNGHVVLGDHVDVLAMSAVSRPLKQPGTYAGTVPAMEHAQWRKNFARLRQLDDMVRRVQALEKELAALRQQERVHGC
jgi:UDP-3-O-[3-hydroxymyristoyl] glucosamine N-acyltransferase